MSDHLSYYPYAQPLPLEKLAQFVRRRLGNHVGSRALVASADHVGVLALAGICDSLQDVSHEVVHEVGIDAAFGADLGKIFPCVVRPSFSARLRLRTSNSLQSLRFVAAVAELVAE